MKKKKHKKVLWSFDSETDPFLYGRKPEPFAWCALSEHGDRFISWGDNATAEFINWILSLDENNLFVAHHGGKFDTIFIKKIIHGSMLMVDGRIIKCNLINGIEVRDSFAILPMALAKLGGSHGHKLDIDYRKMEREVRENHKAEILHYLIQDCITLLGAIENFYNHAGARRLTIAGQASRELRACYPDLPKLSEQHYKEFNQFFFGGRVQAFQKGIIHGKFKLYDVNSMYPDRMANEYHPYGTSYRIIDFSLKDIPENNCGFFMGTLDANGCFPIRQKDKTTPYSIGNNLDVKITIHELKAALDCGLTKNIRGKLIIANNATKFTDFILPHFDKRAAAKECGDDGADLYHKLIPNSSYGRFAMSPDGREETYFADHGENIKEFFKEGWKIKDIDLDCERVILSREVTKPWLFYEDVATGASITGAARAKLMRAIHGSRDVLYCDTDSVMCAEFGGGEVGKKLGEWKEEAEFETAAIAGKKMYCLISGKRSIKTASKGVKATPDEIFMVAAGDEIEIFNPAPILRLKDTRFMSRRIKIT